MGKRGSQLDATSPCPSEKRYLGDPRKNAPLLTQPSRRLPPCEPGVPSPLRREARGSGRAQSLTTSGGSSNLNQGLTWGLVGTRGAPSALPAIPKVRWHLPRLQLLSATPRLTFPRLSEREVQADRMEDTWLTGLGLVAGLPEDSQNQDRSSS